MLSDVTTTRISSLMDKELRASHAGETGAVWIYRGALVANVICSLVSFGNTRNTEHRHALRNFALTHLTTEREHLRTFEEDMPPFRGSFALMIWIVAGFLTGFLPRLLGCDWFYFTIYHVEHFVDKHYANQIDALKAQGNCHDVVVKMCSMQCDEQEHRDEAFANMRRRPTALMNVWGKLVGKGSHTAVLIAKRL